MDKKETHVTMRWDIEKPKLHNFKFEVMLQKSMMTSFEMLIVSFMLLEVR